MVVKKTSVETYLTCYHNVMHNILLVRDTVPLSEIKTLAKEIYGTMIKGVVDLDREIIALGGEWHMDANNVLIADGSQQPSLWGFNIIFGLPHDQWIEYHSLINIRPAQGNRSQEIKDEKLREQMRKIIDEHVDISL